MNEPPKVIHPSKLRELREAKGLSMEELAAAVRALGVPLTNSQVARYENGLYSPRRNRRPGQKGKLEAIAEVLKVKPDELLHVPPWAESPDEGKDHDRAAPAA